MTIDENENDLGALFHDGGGSYTTPKNLERPQYVSETFTIMSYSHSQLLFKHAFVSQLTILKSLVFRKNSTEKIDYAHWFMARGL